MIHLFIKRKALSSKRSCFTSYLEFCHKTSSNATQHLKEFYVPTALKIKISTYHNIAIPNFIISHNHLSSFIPTKPCITKQGFNNTIIFLHHIVAVFYLVLFQIHTKLLIEITCNRPNYFIFIFIVRSPPKIVLLNEKLNQIARL